MGFVRLPVFLLTLILYPSATHLPTVDKHRPARWDSRRLRRPRVSIRCHLPFLSFSLHTTSLFLFVSPRRAADLDELRATTRVDRIDPPGREETTTPQKLVASHPLRCPRISQPPDHHFRTSPFPGPFPITYPLSISGHSFSPTLSFRSLPGFVPSRIKTPE